MGLNLDHGRSWAYPLTQGELMKLAALGISRNRRINLLGDNMKRSWKPGFLGYFLLGIGVLMAAAASYAASSIYDFTMPLLDGKPAPIADYKGKVVLVVNVASRCGFTPQYTALEAIYEKYRDQGFVIIGFPANNFGGQEPGTNEEIKEFCTSKYSVKFPVYAKVSVKGDDQTPLYSYLTKEANPAVAGDIKWNFTKFLVDRDGKVVQRFEPAVTPDSPEVTAAIEKLLK
jgi:glutathione peroxidase